MCGIIGVIGKINGKSKIIAKCMLKSIKHRGPDDHGLVIKKDIILGNNRLSIRDLSKKGHQPMFNEDKSIIITFNGEIYNSDELKKKLKEKHKFISKTDTEVLVHLYEEKGISFINDLNGMFAFCLYDLKKQETFLVRDRIGEKSIYYYIDSNNDFYFSSEMKSFLDNKHYFEKFSINKEALFFYFGFPYIPLNNKTLINEINKLEAGTYMHIKEKKITKVKYWDLKFNQRINKLTYNEAKTELYQLLDDAVRIRLISDVPLGIMLSGGIDSSLISAFMKKYLVKVKSYTASFQHENDESNYAKIVAEYLDLEHTKIDIKNRDIINNLENFIDLYDDLTTTDGGMITTYLLSKKMKDNSIKVVLSGEGSDEVFGGYARFGLSKRPFNILPLIFKANLYYYLIFRQIRKINFKYGYYIYTILKSFKEKDTFRKLSKFEITYALPNHYNLKIDKGTMKASVEARLPYLDYRLVEFVYSLPLNYKIKGIFYNFFSTNEKRILRDIAIMHLPSSIYKRKKRGLMLPIFGVMNSDKLKVRKYILEKNIISKNIFNKEVLESLFKKNIFGLFDESKGYLLWNLLLLEVWANKYFSEGIEIK